MLPATQMLATKKWAAVSWVFLLGVVLTAGLAGCMPPGPRAVVDGERLMREGKYDRAVQELKTATELLPQNAKAWNYLGLAYHHAGQWTNATQAYRRALRLDQNLAAARYNLGCL